MCGQCQTDYRNTLRGRKNMDCDAVGIAQKNRRVPTPTFCGGARLELDIAKTCHLTAGLNPRAG
jgi:hypothetical protein